MNTRNVPADIRSATLLKLTTALVLTHPDLPPSVKTRIKDQARAVRLLVEASREKLAAEESTALLSMIHATGDAVEVEWRKVIAKAAADLCHVTQTLPKALEPGALRADADAAAQRKGIGS